MPQPPVPPFPRHPGAARTSQAIAVPRLSPQAILLRGLMLLSLLVMLLAAALPVRAADRAKVDAFISVTGYDVVIESLQLGAMAAPALSDNQSGRFAQLYTDLARETFEPAALRARAVDLLAKLLSDDLLHAGAELYASDLGQELVAVENASHVTDYYERQARGAELFAELTRTNPQRLRAIATMQQAVSNDDLSVAGMVEVQLRFLLAAREAGQVPMDLSEAELRERLTQLARARLPEIHQQGFISALWTYRDIKDEDIRAYTEALSSPQISALYEVLNKVQYQVMIEFYEKLGLRLAEIAPETDL